MPRNQETDAQKREQYLYDKIQLWLTETDYFAEDDLNLIQFYKNKGSKVRYTGEYFLPIKKTDDVRISQAFFGRTSHAGKTKNRDRISDGYLGAVDIAAPYGTPVYSVLPGEVVNVGPSSQYHRVTVKTEINGETYYLEYLHMAKQDVAVGDKIRMGTQVGVVGDIGSKDNVHLDFRVYQFKNGEEGKFNIESAKKFYDPFEFFDFDVQYEYVDLEGYGNQDYH